MSKITITYTLELEFDAEKEMRTMNKVCADIAKNSDFWLKQYLQGKADYIFKQKAKDSANFTVKITEANK